MKFSERVLTYNDIEHGDEIIAALEKIFVVQVEEDGEVLNVTVKIPVTI